jgi:hypothetical protein
MTERAARAIAKTVHEGQKTAAGSPVFDHLRRVAAAVPRQARVTAWLHDVLERTDLTIGQLRARGVSPVELSALVFLTRPQGDDYRFYVQRIADALGPAGALARVVKLADLGDHLAGPPPAATPTPPYEWARRTILLACAQASSSMRK